MEWMLLVVLVTSEVRVEPVSPIICATWAIKTSRGEIPTYNGVPVIFSMCGQMQPADLPKVSSRPKSR
jgi:hypothetical protein